MKRTRKLILALVVVMSLLMAMAVAIIPASAADTEARTPVYLKPNSNWKSDSAWFAVYYWNNSGGNGWARMVATDNTNNTYVAFIPSGYTSYKYVRMNSSKNTTDWNSKWNEGSNLTVPSKGGNNCYSISGWDNGGGSWSKITTTYKTVYFKNTSNWSNVYCHAWVDNGNRDADVTAWNGLTMTNLGEGIWSCQLPTIVNSVIFNDNSSQTDDLSIKTDNCQLYDFGAKAWSEYHVDADKNHVCDVCAKTNLGTHADSNTDKDHVCDYGCGATLEQCYGGTATCTEQAECTVCGEKYGEALGHDHEDCPHKAVVGETYYESIKDAIDNAESGTITLVDDVTYEGTLAITNENIVIDLNGNNLVADGIVTFGYGVQIIDSGATKGLIDVDREKLVFAPLVDEETGDETPATSTEIVPVWNGEGYVIADVTDRYVQPEVEGKADDSFIIDFKPKFDGVAHSYVKGGETATGLTFEVRITGGDFDKTYTVEDSLIAEAYNGKSVRLNLINAQEGVTYTVQLIIKSECGLNYVGELGQYTYPVPVDAE